MRELKNKVAVVTGAASGIGFALAERFAAEGMRVVLADVEEAALAKAAAALEGRGAKLLAVRTDVTDAAAVEALAEKTMAAFGGVHVLCNNAGVAGDISTVWETSLRDWQWVLNVNLFGVVHGITAFVPRMLQQGEEGHVVNTASMAGHIALPLLAPYHASKFAVVAISESLHHELAIAGAPVKVSVLCPGFVKTNIMTSERNRPGTPAAASARSEFAQAFRAQFDALVASGMAPAQVADTVVGAIRADRFWIFPHPDILAAFQERAESIVAQRNPVFTQVPGAAGARQEP